MMLKRLIATITSEIDLQTLVLLVGLALMSVGLWEAWRPGAYLAPGVILVWMALPARRPFIHRPLVSRKKARTE